MQFGFSVRLRVLSDSSAAQAMTARLAAKSLDSAIRRVLEEDALWLVSQNAKAGSRNGAKLARAETVRPQLGERCEKRRECDSVLSATNDENGDELKGETGDEDMEDGEMGFDKGSASEKRS